MKDNKHMLFTRTGIILYVQKYAECVKFYEKALCLPVMFRTSGLTCFEFGGGYLMVEPEDEEHEAGRNFGQNTCIRMNVPNVRKSAETLIERGVEIDYQEHSWGTVAKFSDPDGNLCAFKDDDKFERQIESCD
jgi:lactoylglutathione lyase